MAALVSEHWYLKAARRIGRWRISLFSLPALLFIALVLVAAVWWFPKFELAHSSGSQEHQYRKDAEQSLLLFGGLVALAFTFWQVLLTRKGQFTDRFTKAVSMLTQTDDGKPLIESRIGALLALEHLANDSFQDRPRVLELISAYVKQNAPWRPPANEQDEIYDPEDDASLTRPPRADITTAVRVLARCHRFLDQKIDLDNVNLAGHDLQGLRLGHVSLQSSNLCKAELQDADLRGANLQNTWLWKANLTNARLDGAHLRRANLTNSKLGDTSWDGADVSAVDFTNSDVSTKIFKAEFFWEAVFDDSFRESHSRVFDQEQAAFKARSKIRPEPEQSDVGKHTGNNNEKWSKLKKAGSLELIVYITLCLLFCGVAGNGLYSSVIEFRAGIPWTVTTVRFGYFAFLVISVGLLYWRASRQFAAPAKFWWAAFLAAIVASMAADGWQAWFEGPAKGLPRHFPWLPLLYYLLFLAASWWVSASWVPPRSAGIYGAPPECRAHLILFLSDIRDSTFHPEWLTESGRNLSDDLARLAEEKSDKSKSIPLWKWEQPLRAINYHLQKLKAVTVIASKESILQAQRFADVLTKYAKLKEIDFKLLLNAGEQETRLAELTTQRAASDGFDFEDFGQLSTALHRFLTQGNLRESDIMIDFTGGQKVTSVVAAALTFNREVRAQYVQTGPPWAVRSYTIVTVPSPI